MSLSIKKFLRKVLHRKLYWKFRHLFDSHWPERYLTPEAFEHIHRQQLVDMISQYDFKNCLEFGCGAGTNLILLAKKFPNRFFAGYDISEKALEIGMSYTMNLRIDNVCFFRNFPFQKFDIIFTDRALLYCPKMLSLIEAHAENVILCEKDIELPDYYIKNPIIGWDGFIAVKGLDKGQPFL